MTYKGPKTGEQERGEVKREGQGSPDHSKPHAKKMSVAVKNSRSSALERLHPTLLQMYKGEDIHEGKIQIKMKTIESGKRR